MDSQQVEIDFDATLESMGRQLSAAAREVAIKDGVIAALTKEINQMKETIDQLAPRAEGDES